MPVTSLNTATRRDPRQMDPKEVVRDLRRERTTNTVPPHFNMEIGPEHGFVPQVLLELEWPPSSMPLFTLPYLKAGVETGRGTEKGIPISFSSSSINSSSVVTHQEATAPAVVQCTTLESTEDTHNKLSSMKKYHPV